MAGSRQVRGERARPQSEARRHEIMVHAARLFSDRGFDETSINQIASSAGIAKGLVYFYFESKEDLLAEISADLFRQQRERLDVARVGLNAPLELLYLGVLVTSRFFSEHYNIMGVVGSVSNSTLTPYQRSITSHANRTSALLRIGQTQGVVRSNDDPLSLSFAIGSLVTELVRYHKRGVLAGGIANASSLAARSSLYMVASRSEDAERVIERHPEFDQRANEATRLTTRDQEARSATSAAHR